MNKMVIAAVLVGCVYFGHRQFAAARAFAKLQEVPTAPQGFAGFTNIRPTESLPSYVEPGRHTVFIFSAGWCPACRALEAQLPRFASLRPDVAIRTIDVDDRQAVRCAIQGTDFEPHSIPYLVIYDSEGQLVAQDGGFDRLGAKTMGRWMTDEFQKAARPN